MVIDARLNKKPEYVGYGKEVDKIIVDAIKIEVNRYEHSKEIMIKWDVVR